MKSMKIALLCALGLAGTNALACYTVYDRSNRVVYNELTPPVDMARPLHETLPQRFPGGQLVFDANATCPRTTAAGNVAGTTTASTGPAPLLTDVATASALRLPHTTLAGNIAVVPGQAVAKLDLPTFTVVPADTVALAAARPAMATTAMGAGPAAAPRAAVQGSVRAAPQQRPGGYAVLR